MNNTPELPPFEITLDFGELLWLCGAMGIARLSLITPTAPPGDWPALQQAGQQSLSERQLIQAAGASRWQAHPVLIRLAQALAEPQQALLAERHTPGAQPVRWTGFFGPGLFFSCQALEAERLQFRCYPQREAVLQQALDWLALLGSGGSTAGSDGAGDGETTPLPAGLNGERAVGFAPLAWKDAALACQALQSGGMSAPVAKQVAHCLAETSATATLTHMTWEEGQPRARRQCFFIYHARGAWSAAYDPASQVYGQLLPASRESAQAAFQLPQSASA